VSKRRQLGLGLQNLLVGLAQRLFFVTKHIDSPDGSINTGMSHVSITEIACLSIITPPDYLGSLGMDLSRMRHFMPFLSADPNPRHQKFSG